MTLKEIIEKLKKCRTKSPVTFDFDETLIVDPQAILDSYRGYHNELAIGYIPKSQLKGRRMVTVKVLREACEKAIGKTFEGYKGTEYVMTEDTNIWVAEWGIDTGIKLVEVSTSKKETRLLTKRVT